jgi:hypothetical protein
MFKTQVNTNQNFGYSSKLNYDASTYSDRLIESTDPLHYRLNTNQIYNCNSCLTGLGPRGRFGVNTTAKNQVALAQAPEVVNLESILTNRNVYKSKNRSNGANPVDLNKLNSVNHNRCNNFLNSSSSRLTLPTANYRELPINRFYDLNKNPQENLFWNYTINSKLEAKDNYVEILPQQWASTFTVPHAEAGQESCRSAPRQCPTTSY